MRKNKTFRLIKNIVIAGLSIAWILPLWLSAKFTFRNLSWMEGELINPNSFDSQDYPFWASISPFEEALIAFEWAMILLALTIFIFIFITLCKHRPIVKNKDEK